MKIKRAHMVCRSDELGDGARIIVTCGSIEIGVFNLSREYFALLNRCPHKMAPLCKRHQRGHVTAESNASRAPPRRALLSAPRSQTSESSALRTSTGSVAPTQRQMPMLWSLKARFDTDNWACGNGGLGRPR